MVKTNKLGLIGRCFLAGAMLVGGALSGCVSNHYEASKQYWKEVRQGKRANPNHYEVSKRYWANVRKENAKRRNQDNHRHYPSVDEKLQERVGTYFLFKGLEGLESFKK